VDLGDMESFYSSGGGDLLDQIEIWLLVNSSKKSGSPLKAVIPGPEPDPFDVGKITKKDYRTRIRPGFYRRGNDYLRYDEVFPVGPRRHKGAPLDASNWYVSVTGPLTGGTPGQGTPAAAGNHYPVWQLISAGWRRVDKAKLPAAWKDWFDKNPPR
jgi:hypothetical protein